MKKMKKIVAFLLATVMVLGMSMTVFADTAGGTQADATSGYTVTITGEFTGHIYEAYQIFAGDLDSTGKVLSNVTWGKNIKGEEFVNYLSTENTGVFKDGTTNNIFSGLTQAAEIADKLKSYSNNDEMLDEFAKAAGNYLTGDPAGSSTEQDSKTYTITGLSAGYYLIKDRDESIKDTEHDYYTKFMLTVVGDATATVKGSVPKIDKKVNTSINGTYTESVDVQIGEVFYYKVEGTLPSNFEIYDTYTYIFEDTFSEGLTFGKIEAVYIENAEGTSQKAIPEVTSVLDSEEGLSKTPGYEWKVEDVIGEDEKETGETKITLTIEDLKALNHTYNLSDKIVVKYSATLNENAKIGQPNVNNVKLKYSNNPYTDSYGTTPKDTALVYTFGMDVDKVDSIDSTKKLSGAEFILYKREITEIDGKEYAIYHYVLFDENGKAYSSVSSEAVPVNSITPMKVWEATQAKYADNDSINIGDAIFVSDAKGNVKVSGLDGSVYRMLEIKAPDGYNLPNSRFVITFTPSYNADGTLKGLLYEVDSVLSPDENEDGYSDSYDGVNGNIKVTIENSQGTTLPSTGGIGTTVFYIIGGVLVAAAVILLVTKKRMRAE